jgi:hypothetical protein
VRTSESVSQNCPAGLRLSGRSSEPTFFYISQASWTIRHLLNFAILFHHIRFFIMNIHFISILVILRTSVSQNCLAPWHPSLIDSTGCSVCSQAFLLSVHLEVKSFADGHIVYPIVHVIVLSDPVLMALQSEPPTSCSDPSSRLFIFNISTSINSLRIFVLHAQDVYKKIPDNTGVD